MNYVKTVETRSLPGGLQASTKMPQHLVPSIKQGQSVPLISLFIPFVGSILAERFYNEDHHDAAAPTA